MPPLEFDKYYHIYNRGNNREDLFRCDKDYNYFLSLIKKYINPVAEIFTWVLMKNHYHLLIRIKSEPEIGLYLPLEENDPIKFQTTGRNNLTESAGNNLTEFKEPVRVIPHNSTNSEIPVPPSINSDRSDDSVRLNPPPPINSDRSNDSVRLKPNPGRHFAHLFNAYTRYYNLKYKRTGVLFERPFKRIEVISVEYFKKLVLYIHTNPVHHGFTDDYINYPWSGYQSIVTSPSTAQTIIDWFCDLENFKAMHQMKVNTELLSEILLE